MNLDANIVNRLGLAADMLGVVLIAISTMAPAVRGDGYLSMDRVLKGDRHAVWA